MLLIFFQNLDNIRKAGKLFGQILVHRNIKRDSNNLRNLSAIHCVIDFNDILTSQGLFYD